MVLRVALKLQVWGFGYGGSGSVSVGNVRGLVGSGRGLVGTGLSMTITGICMMGTGIGTKSSDAAGSVGSGSEDNFHQKESQFLFAGITNNERKFHHILHFLKKPR